MIFDIETAIVNRLDTGTGSGEYNFLSTTVNANIPVFTTSAIDNRSADIVPRVEFDYLPTDLDPDSNCTNEQTGTFQISVFVQSNAGQGTQAKIIQDFTALYGPKTFQDITDTRIHFRDLSVSPGRADGAFWRRDVSVNYYCYLEG